MKGLVCVIGIALLMAVCFSAGRCSAEGGEGDTLSVRVDSFRDTVFNEVHDTVPVVKRESVLCYVPGQICPARDREERAERDREERAERDHDSLAVVQREYSDDSTYTAWVSGVRYAEWPKLDSVTVRQREVLKTIHEKVTLVEKHKARRLSVGITGGLGIGITTRRPDVWIGVGMVYRIPP